MVGSGLDGGAEAEEDRAGRSNPINSRTTAVKQLQPRLQQHRKKFRMRYRHLKMRILERCKILELAALSEHDFKVE